MNTRRALSWLALPIALFAYAGCQKTKWKDYDPTASPSANESAAPLPSVLPDPVEALHQRTYAIEVHDDLVHAGTTAGVVSWNLSDPTVPKRVASLTLRGSVQHLAQMPDTSLLVVSTGPSGVALVDTKEAREGKLTLLNPHPWPTELRKACHAAWHAALLDSKTAVVACGGSGVIRLDVSDPTAPVLKKQVLIPGYARDIAVLGKKGVVAAGRKGVALIDFGNAVPRVMEQLDLNADARAVAIHDQVAYVAAGERGLVMVDISHAPLRILGELLPKTTDMARGIALSESHAFLCLGDSGLAVIDITDPAKPTELSRFDPKGAVNRATRNGSQLLIANDAYGVAVLDVSNPKTPALMTRER
ncbi:MAG TPA: hypothetical protein PKL24_05020 [Polyangiaceae bacterium]|jgi:hypothetical protein|nr:MAG: LVIVD repeat protein [Deltaproteobacteria bacterium ADurb.Bin207]HNZ21484.1 hypothetical protein [Polyangiaceae bacterium]HOD23664.1 hypothetical protein [Polyangiaceae bacterium]HOE50038.1 hypothetical protein [Polyangiaceae bacterium]HOH00805.1 hypothetical protein [Polyangiaceae bacterium]